MSAHTIEIEVVVVPKAVKLEDEVVYIYRGGKLLRCGALKCIDGHLDYLIGEGADASDVALVREHFDGSWDGYATKGPHVIREPASEPGASE